jgi:rhomboid family GlyGly-CTERM serine protease
MNVASPITINTARGPIPRAVWSSRNVELAGFSALLFLLNLPLLVGGSTDTLAYSAEAIANGEWWRWLTHPFVHISRYHFLLDSIAFLALYHSLREPRSWYRLAEVLVIAASSLAVASIASPLIASHGLRGLSGIAHGLMALCTLEACADPSTDRTSRQVSAIAFLILVAKCLFELAGGSSLFGCLHAGDVGTPIVACHAGGVLGALAWWCIASHPTKQHLLAA